MSVQAHRTSSGTGTAGDDSDLDDRDRHGDSEPASHKSGHISHISHEAIRVVPSNDNDNDNDNDSVNDRLNAERLTQIDSFAKTIVPKFGWVVSEPVSRVFAGFMDTATCSCYTGSSPSTNSNSFNMTAEQSLWMSDCVADVGSLLFVDTIEDDSTLPDVGGSNVIADRLQHHAIREYLGAASVHHTPCFVNATQVILAEPVNSERKFSRTSPLPFIGLQLALDDKGGGSTSASAAATARQLYYLHTSNTHTLWILTKWIQLAIDVWSNRIEADDLPPWAAVTGVDGCFQCTVSLSQSLLSDSGKEGDNEGDSPRPHKPQSAAAAIPGAVVSTVSAIGSAAVSSLGGSNSWNGNCSIDLSKPFQLRILDAATRHTVFSLPLHSLRSLAMSWDAAPSSGSHSVELDILGTNFSIVQDANSALVSEDENNKYGPKGNFGFRRWVRRTATEAAMGVAAITLSTAGTLKRNIKSGDAAATLTAAQSSLIATGKDFVGLVASTGTTIAGFGQTATYVVIRCGSMRQIAVVPEHQDSSVSLWDSAVCVDLNIKNSKVFPAVEAARRQFIRSDDRDGRETSGNVKSDSHKSALDRNVDLYLFHGQLGSESLVAQKSIKASKFLSGTVEETLTEDKHIVLRSLLEVQLDSEIGLRVTFIGARGLSQSHKSNLITGVYLKAKLASADGSSVDSLPGQRTPTVKASSDVDWKHDLFFSANDGLDQAYFVRVKIMSGSLLGEECLGLVFIPLEDFPLKTSVERTYSVLRDKSVTGVGGQGGSDGIGTITVSLLKLVEDAEAMPHPIKLALRATLRESSPFSCAWPAEASLAGSLEAPSDGGVIAETGLVMAPTHDALVLLDRRALTAMPGLKQNDRQSPDLALLAQDSLKASPEELLRQLKGRTKSSQGDKGKKATPKMPEKKDEPFVLLDDIEVAVFENQRRHIFPPFEWGDGNLLTGERSRFSDEVGNPVSGPRDVSAELDATKAPAGFEWCTEPWVLDMEYTTCDADGWSYAVDFSIMSKNYRNNASKDTSFGRSVRRRKWLRIAKQIRPLNFRDRVVKFSESKQGSPNKAEVDDVDTDVDVDETGPLSQSKSRRHSRRTATSHDSLSLAASYEFAIFEHQRRQLLPPYDWGDGNLLRVERRQFSDETGNHSFDFAKLSDALPPKGFEWADDWRLDRKYTQTDADGWSYGPSFPFISSNLRKGHSAVSPLGRAVRRRRWLRVARRVVGWVDNSNDDEALADHSQADRCLSLNFLADKKAQDELDQLSGSIAASWRTEMVEAANAANTLTISNLAAGIASIPIAAAANIASIPKAAVNEVIGSNSSSKAEDKDELQHDATKESKAAISATAAALSASASNLQCTGYVSSNKLSILSLCRERCTADAPILIPWSKVVGCAVISPSVLNVTITIHRFFKTSSKFDSSFREVTVELFVLNCPAIALQSLIYDRIGFTDMRSNIQRLVISGNITGNIELDDGATQPVSSLLEDSELSLGSATFTELEGNAMLLETHLKSLCAKHLKLAWGGGAQSAQLSEDVLRLARRRCRLQLYKTALLLSNLRGHHNYSEEDARRVLNGDLSAAAQIEQENEVSTASNRIEFLIDTAETRLRDAALCGWNAREGKGLEAAVEVLVNGYFFEMVTLLAKYFDPQNSKMNSVQGLQSKINLITTFMKHNDHIDIILKSALQPYGLVATPSPLLSRHLNFESLLSWYTMALKQEMLNIVGNAVNVWKDPSQDVSGTANHYKHPLPWHPLREAGESGIFRTLLPEDAVGYLDKYLDYARLGGDDIAPSFRGLIWKVDNKVHQSYAGAFVHLAEAYQRELLSVDWSDPDALCSAENAPLGRDVIAEVLEERAEWLASIANDSRRIVDTSMISRALGLSLDAQQTPPLGDSDDRSGSADDDVKSGLGHVFSLIDQSYTVFSQCLLSAVELLACIIFRELCAEPLHSDTGLLDKGFYEKWSADAQRRRESLGRADANDDVGHADEDNVEVDEDPGLLGLFLIDLGDLMASQIQCLERHCFFRFLSACADKVVLRILLLLQEGATLGFHIHFDSPESAALRQDVVKAKLTFERLLRRSGNEEFLDKVNSQFKLLDQALTIISAEDANEPQVLTELQSLRKIASGQPEAAAGVAQFAHTCLILRDDRDRRVRSARALPSSNTSNEPSNPRRPSILPNIGGFLGAASHQLPQTSLSTHANAGAKEGSSTVDDISSAAQLLVREIEELADSEDSDYIGQLLSSFRHARPEVRVFELCSGRFTVTPVQLVLSASSPSLRVLAHTTSYVTKGAATITQLFSSVLSLGSAAIAATSTDSSAVSHESRMEMKVGLSSTPSSPTGGRGGSSTIVVSGIRVKHPLIIDGSRPKCLLRFSLGSTTVSTAVQESYAPDWSELPLEFPGLPPGSQQPQELRVELIYKTFLRGEEPVGVAYISLEALEFSPIEDQQFPLQLSLNAPSRVRNATEQTSANGQPLPSLHISARPGKY